MLFDHSVNFQSTLSGMNKHSSGSQRKITRRKFTPEEDDQLRQLVACFGTNAWPEIANGMVNRNVRQCRDRWNHYLSSAAAAPPWTAEEDAPLLRTVERLGFQWRSVTGLWANRSELEVQQRWRALSHPGPAPSRGSANADAAAGLASSPMEPNGKTITPSAGLEHPGDLRFRDDQSVIDLFRRDHVPFLGE
jgi:hypothetical protein